MRRFKVVATVLVPHQFAVTVDAEDLAAAVAAARTSAGVTPEAQFKPQWSLVDFKDEQFIGEEVFERFCYSHCRHVFDSVKSVEKCPICHQEIEPFYKE